jgi:Acetyltransferase (GNAT) domain
MTGYAHAAYAASLAELGTPRHLPESGGWILVRPVPCPPHPDDVGVKDAMGCYPVFSCENWSRLGRDLDALGPDLVSLTIVTDPFGAYTESQLRQVFPDLVRPFKEHFVVDVRQPLDHVSPHHRRNLAKASRHVRIERCPDPAALASVWCALYEGLVARHGVNGFAAFSRAALTRQLEVPGVVIFRAESGGATTGMTVWYTAGSRAYYHLGAYSEAGYAAGASFAIFDHAVRHFAETGLQWLDLGGAAGLKADGRDGLSRFKRGWATGTRPAYLCGRIFDRREYAALAAAGAARDTSYFPAYRSGEPRASDRPQRHDEP